VADAAVSLSAAAIATIVGGRLEGDGAAVVRAVGSLDRADANSLAFLDSPRYLGEFIASRAGVVLVGDRLQLPDDAGPRTRIVVPSPLRAFSRVVDALFPPQDPVAGVHSTAQLGRGCRLGSCVSIGPFVVLGDGVQVGDRVILGAGVALERGVVVGDGSELGPQVTCYAGTRLGKRVRVKAGAVIGGIGFGYLPGPGGHEQIPHVGGCLIEDDVHIGANCCIDRGSVDDTIIGTGTRLDNHVHIGHNARLGARCLVMAGVVVAGSARIGDEVVLAGHSAIGGHFRVGDRARVSAKAGVTSEVPDGADVSGFPARPHRDFLRAQAALYRLAPMVAALESLVEQARSRDA